VSTSGSTEPAGGRRAGAATALSRPPINAMRALRAHRSTFCAANNSGARPSFAEKQRAASCCLAGVGDEVKGRRRRREWRTKHFPRCRYARGHILVMHAPCNFPVSYRSRCSIMLPHFGEERGSSPQGHPTFPALMISLQYRTASGGIRFPDT
jgi:hypothetical protein